MKIVILERSSVGNDVSFDLFDGVGDVVSYDNTTAVSEVAERASDADIIVANKAPLSREALRHCQNLKLICELATGYDNCDISYCRERGIRVANVVDYSTAMVAQHTFALALALAGCLPYYDGYVKSGAYAAQSRFSHFDLPFYELEGKTWGVAGNGNIGKRVASIAEAFGCNIICYSFTGRIVQGRRTVDKDTLLRESDFLSLHCPLSDLSRNFIDAEALDKMKHSAILINVSRGPVVNGSDLFDALTSGKIRGAGLDVLENEPITDWDPLSRFTDSNRLIITPHLAWASVEARQRCVNETLLNIKAFLKGEMRCSVNGI